MLNDKQMAYPSDTVQRMAEAMKMVADQHGACLDCDLIDRGFSTQEIRRWCRQAREAASQMQ